jgi:hypothetical protein
MEPFGALLFGALAASIAYLIASTKGRARAAAWHNAAGAVGLTEVELRESFGIPSRLTGRSGPLEVTLERYQRGKQESGTRISIAGMGHGLAGLSLRREGLATAFEKVVGEREIELGDPAFDAELFVQGSAPLARALLDAETRRVLVGLLRGQIPVSGGTVKARVSLTGGVLRADLQERPFSAPGARLPEVLATLRTVARRLVAPADIALRLAENLRSEPAAGVRLQGLLMLLREHGDHPAAREALLAARADPSAEVRLRAGIALGDEGRDLLLELAGAEDTADACAAGAVAALSEQLPHDRTEEILRLALRARRTATARACIERLGRGGKATPVAMLAKVLALEPGELGVAAAQALGALGLPAAQPALVAALASPAPPVRAAAAAALGRAGDVDAVLPLRQAPARYPADGALKRAVRQAVAEIQSRLAGAAPGQLSLVAEGAEAGRLSLADTGGVAAGRLSLADPVDRTSREDGGSAQAPPGRDAEPAR